MTKSILFLSFALFSSLGCALELDCTNHMEGFEKPQVIITASIKVAKNPKVYTVKQGEYLYTNEKGYTFTNTFVCEPPAEDRIHRCQPVRRDPRIMDIVVHPVFGFAMVSEESGAMIFFNCEDAK